MTSEECSRCIRRYALEMVSRARASHIAGALSMADILAVLYTDILRYNSRDPHWDDRDRVILSKGHACTALYAVLALKGFFPLAELASYGTDDTRLMSHASHKVPGVEFSSGSLGHGLPFGVGKALAAKRTRSKWRTFVILSDGEMDEGSNWEAILFAGHHRLNNLVAIVDFNKIQSLGSVKDVLDLGDLRAKFEQFGWDAVEIDGHDHKKLNIALQSSVSAKPRAVVAHTIKGKGVSYMEGKLLWHYRNPDSEQLKSALNELGFKSTD